MAATPHHCPRCVILSNATPLRGGRRGMQAGAPECPPGPREQGSGLWALWQLRAALTALTALSQSGLWSERAHTAS